jgi:hypothetical protein
MEFEFFLSRILCQCTNATLVTFDTLDLNM